MDEFYTYKPSKLLKYIQKYITDEDILIEPSCGAGAFLNILKFNKCYDIVKKVDTDIFECRDFLTVNNIEPNCCFIGNPPFGKNSKLAVEFCKRCCELNAKFIMFILPEVFKQEKYKNIAFKSCYHLIEEHNYNEFIKDGRKVNVNCVFQIWKREDYDRENTKNVNTKCKYFKYITKSKISAYVPNEHTFSIRRVGSKTPELTKGVHESLEDHFIIELYKQYDVNSFIQQYNEYNFEISPSTKQKHITQQKLNEQVNRLIVSVLENIQFNENNLNILEKINTKTINAIMKSDKYKQELSTLLEHIKKYTGNDNITVDDILRDEYFTHKIITPQQKASIRGHMFNKYVYKKCCSVLGKEYIRKEYKHKDYPEILDIYINFNGKELFIYNKIDLWSGGEQINRCDKYLSHPQNSLLCIVISKPTFKQSSKAYNLIIDNINKHIIWFSDIENYLCKYFDIRKMSK